MTTATIASDAALELDNEGATGFSQCEKLVRWLKRNLEEGSLSWIMSMYNTFKRDGHGLRVRNELLQSIDRVTGHLDAFVKGNQTPSRRLELRQFCLDLSSQYQQEQWPLRRLVAA